MPFISPFTWKIARANVGVQFVTIIATAHGLVIALLAIALPTVGLARRGPFVKKVLLELSDKSANSFDTVILSLMSKRSFQLWHGLYFAFDFIIHTTDCFN